MGNKFLYIKLYINKIHNFTFKLNIPLAYEIPLGKLNHISLCLKRLLSHLLDVEIYPGKQNINVDCGRNNGNSYLIPLMLILHVS